MSSLAQRVAARFAARMYNFRPWPMEPCHDCNGQGMVEEKKFEIVRLCIRCWGSKVDPKPLKDLQKELESLEKKIQSKEKDFEVAKAKAMGRGGRYLGMMGRELQTLQAKWRFHKDTLEEQQTRRDKGKELARFAGAMAR